MRVLALAGFALLAVACAPPSSARHGATLDALVTARPAPVTAAPPTPTLVNVDDMMGYFQQQTVFVSTPEWVSAVTLLNHFTRYRIATNGAGQVTASTGGTLLFVLDADTSGGQRLRTIDAASGAERAAQRGVLDVIRSGRALSGEQPGRLLVLKADAQHAWVEAFDATTLRPLGTVAEGPACGDLLLANAVDVAMICRAEGEIVVDNLRGSRAAVEGAGSAIAAAGLAQDGTLYLATGGEQPFTTVERGTAHATRPTWPDEWTGTVVTDSLAVSDGLVVLAQRSGDSAFVRAFDPRSMGQRKSWQLAGVPNAGLLAMWPFAYYTVGATIRHVDLTSGLLETMTEVGDGAVPAAVVNS